MQRPDNGATTAHIHVVALVILAGLLLLIHVLPALTKLQVPG